MKKKFYRYEFKVVVLTDREYDPEDLGQIHYDTTDGEFSGVFEDGPIDELTSLEMAKALIDQGSDPEFFGLNDDGTELEEE
jgi:hypothetical protein